MKQHLGAESMHPPKRERKYGKHSSCQNRNTLLIRKQQFCQLKKVNPAQARNEQLRDDKPRIPKISEKQFMQRNETRIKRSRNEPADVKIEIAMQRPVAQIINPVTIGAELAGVVAGKKNEKEPDNQKTNEDKIELTFRLR